MNTRETRPKGQLHCSGCNSTGRLAESGGRHSNCPSCGGSGFRSPTLGDIWEEILRTRIDLVHKIKTKPPRPTRAPLNVLMYESAAFHCFRPKCQLCGRRAGTPEVGFFEAVDIYAVGEFKICEVCVIKLDKALET